MVIFRFIYYVILKPFARIIFGITDNQPKSKIKKSAFERKSDILSKNSNNHTSELKGQEFEEFIAKKFNRNKGYVLKEWRGDKYSEGTYAESNLYPDLEFEISKGTTNYRFAIECKWRSNYYKDKLDLFKETQLTNYWRFAAEKNIPVFVAIGIGRSGDFPSELYILPLSKIKRPFLYKSELQDYRFNAKGTFLYNTSNKYIYQLS